MTAPLTPNQRLYLDCIKRLLEPRVSVWQVAKELKVNPNAAHEMVLRLVRKGAIVKKGGRIVRVP